MSHDAAHENRMHGEPEEPHGVTVPTPHHHVNYIACFLALVGLTVATVLAYYVFRTSESELIKVLVALAIAAVKAAVVAMFFMHLKFEGKLIYLIFFVPLLLCVLMIVALIPDIIMTEPGSNSSSLHLFNSVSHLFQAAMGGE